VRVEWVVLDTLNTELILCGVDGTGRVTGSSLGPFALWHFGIMDALRGVSQLQSASVFGPYTVSTEGRDGFPPERQLSVSEAFEWLGKATGAALDHGNRTPVICLGDHTFSAASVAAGVARIPGLQVLWIDAHADLNTPATSPSGNLHGMPAAMLTHLTIPTAESFAQYRDLLPRDCLAPTSLHYWGVRDLDTAEREILRGHPGFVATMSDIDRFSTSTLAEKLLERIAPGGPLWISFDIDSVDPLSAPGTGTPVPEGLTKREALTLAEILAGHAAEGRVRIAGVEVVELNPLRDKGRSCDFAVTWVASILGKSIL